MARRRTEASGPDVDLANRYVGLAMRLARRYQQPLGVHKLSMCRACATYRSPATARTRIHRNRVVITCLQCGEIRRRPL
jgi:ribonuclease P protein subunit RPR2